MEKELAYSIKSLKNAFQRLVEGCARVKDNLDEDGVIQRFEFTFELVWKTLKIYLEVQGIVCNSPKECLQEAFKIDIISNEKVFMNMLKDRNTTAHNYDENVAHEIFVRIRKNYVPAIKQLMEQLSRTPK